VIDLCAVDAIGDGEARLFERVDGKERTGVILVRDGDALRAYVNACPHFGIPLDIGQGIKTFRKHLLCVNHYAVFRFGDGACIDGPCTGAALDAVAVAVRDGRVVLDDPAYAGVSPR
jgi:nitrite reductase/ring-hydroxylating ferredoxin subunit